MATKHTVGEWIFIAAFFAVVTVTAFGVPYLKYRECRAHGFSVFYCVTK
jgi:hypothetical protein